MSKNKMGVQRELPERKAIQEQDDELNQEDGIGPGSNAQSAQFREQDSSQHEQFTRAGSKRATSKGYHIRDASQT